MQVNLQLGQSIVFSISTKNISGIDGRLTRLISCYNARVEKLVRDKIPEILLGLNKQPKTRIATLGEYKKKLREKLQEETDEYIASGAKEEIADILEVIDAICEANNIDKKEIEEIKEKKKRERGGFRQRIILEIKK